MYPRLPDPPEPERDQTLIAYGASLLKFVLATGTTATLSSEQLELIDHAYPLAVSAPDLTPATRQRLTDARHDVLAAIARRRQPAQDTPAPAQTPAHDIPGGKVARLQPPPLPQPPPSSYAPLVALDF